MGSSYEACKVLVEHDLDINAPIVYFGDILECDVEDDNLDWVRFFLENSANPNLEQAYNEQLVLANAANLPPSR